jgi:hypothetical protein
VIKLEAPVRLVAGGGAGSVVGFGQGQAARS